MRLAQSLVHNDPTNWIYWYYVAVTSYSREVFNYWKTKQFSLTNWMSTISFINNTINMSKTENEENNQRTLNLKLLVVSSYIIMSREHTEKKKEYLSKANELLVILEKQKLNPTQLSLLKREQARLSYAQQQPIPKTLSLFKESIQYDPLNFPCWIDLCYYLWESQKLSAAESSFIQCSKIFSNQKGLSVTANYHLAYFYYTTKQYNQAEPILNNIISSLKGKEKTEIFGNTMFLKGLCQLTNDKAAGSLTLKTAITLNPQLNLLSQKLNLNL